MQTLTQIRTILARHGLRPKHRLGQNFLHDQNLLRKLVDAANMQPGEVVLEVGPGTGTLTELLIERGADVIACEIDEHLAHIVEDRLGERITLVKGDCLQRGRRLAEPVVKAINGRAFKLIANLPYQVASPLMTTLLIEHANCMGQFVTIQKEVADRLLASPHTKAYGPLGIIVQALADVQRITTLQPQSFWPNPKVTSAMVAIVPRHDRIVDDPREFARFITNLFTKRRKQLGTIFGRDQSLPNAISPHVRPETLSVEQLLDLWRHMRAQ